MTAAADEPQPMADPPEDLPKTPEMPVPVVHSEWLLNGRREVHIVHCDEVYRLRLTRNGKLILTK